MASNPYTGVFGSFTGNEDGDPKDENSHYPDLTADQVAEAIRNTADKSE